MTLADSTPIFERPDSVVHWTCPDAPYAGTTHHLVSGGFARRLACRYCKQTEESLKVIQEALYADLVAQRTADRHEASTSYWARRRAT